MERVLVQAFKSIRWVLRSQEEAVRSALEGGGWKIHSLEVKIETEPRQGGTPTSHRFVVRSFLAPPSPDNSDSELRGKVRDLLEIPHDHRWSLGKSSEKPGLWQLLYKSRHQWTDWE